MVFQTVYLGIGSNIGDRERNITKCIQTLSEYAIKDLISAQLFESDPLENINQGKFLNTVVRGCTKFSHFELLEYLKNLEKLSGRKQDRAVKKGPRIIDIDILLYGNLLVRSKNLVIPHKMIKKRKFVLLPLLSLDPCLKDPLTGKFYYTYFLRLKKQGIYYHRLNRYNFASD